MSTDTTVTLDGRTLVVRPTKRGYWSTQEGFDVFEITAEGEQQLTVADPWSHQPTEEELRSFLSPRKQALVALMRDRKIIAGNDYQYEDDYELLEGTEPIGRYVAVYGDETYHQVHVVDTVEAALDSLASIVGEEYCGLPEGVYDLDSGTMHAVKATMRLVKPLGIDHP